MEFEDAYFIALQKEWAQVHWTDTGDYWGIFLLHAAAESWILMQERKDPLPKGMRYDIRPIRHRDSA
jgi:hypothetical protein